MKKLFLLICLIAVLWSCKAQPSFNFKADHTSILVKDVNASAKFYKDVLGLEEISNSGLGERFRWFQFTDKVQLHIIQSEIEVIPQKEIHLAINTDKLNELMEYLRTKKIPFENWPGEANTTNTRPDNVKQIYIQDLDGYWIEINDNKI